MRRHRVNCDLVAGDTVYYATTAEALERLRSESRLRARAGFEHEWLSPGALRRRTGIAARGASRTSGNAQFDPYAARTGLMRAAARAGAAIFERSPVTRIVSTRDHVIVYTTNGRIEASQVVVATGYATRHFRPLAGRFHMYRTYVLGTRPLTDAERREVGLGNVMIWDTERPYHCAMDARRSAPAGRGRPPGRRRSVTSTGLRHGDA